MSSAHLPEAVTQVNGMGGIESNDVAPKPQADDQSAVNSEYNLQEHPIENFRPLKVVVVGAGFSGIYCGIRIPEKLRNVELVIYEKNAGVGGTWYENRYPGCACDIPSHSYQYSFNPNPKWSGLYATAQEIRGYIEDTMRKYSVERFIKLSHKVEECRWNSRGGKWHLKIKDLVNDEIVEDSADVLINARGGLNAFAWPDIDGLNEFKGEVMHSAKWNQEYDFRNRKIGIIGNGSSSIQIVPKLQQVQNTQLTVFARSRTWISPSFGQQLWDSMGMEGFTFSEKQIETFNNDPVALQKFRVAVEEDGNGVHAFTIQGTPLAKGAKDFFAANMKSKLAAKPEIYDEIVPSFAPGCRRLTPGPGYLEALTEPNVTFVKTPISRIEPQGVRTSDSVLHELDVLVCATGFKTFAVPPFPIIGSDSVTISDHWNAYPRTYLSLASDKFPNHFLMLGPNSAIGAGSLTMMMEATGDYIVKCIRKLQRENYKSMAPKPRRVDDFIAYARAYFPRTVYKDQCHSWYKNRNDDVIGLWPGSTLHCLEALRSPRWEDWDYEDLPVEGVGHNRLAWLGNGWTSNQLDGRHMAWYLQPQFLEPNVPVCPLPEESEILAMRPFSY